jgi:hypothetical protein
MAVKAEERPEFVDTLAAAYAVNGQFDKAVTTQRRALSLVPDSRENADMKLEFQKRLEFYTERKVWVEE